MHVQINNSRSLVKPSPVFVDFIKSFEPYLKVEELFIEFDKKRKVFKLSTKPSYSQLTSILNKESKRAKRVFTTGYFKIWSTSVLNFNNKVALNEEDFVDDYSFSCFHSMKKEHTICCFDFFGRPIDWFCKEVNGKANPKVGENCGRLVEVAKRVIKLLNPVRLIIDAETASYINHDDLAFPDNPEGWWFFVYYRDPYDFVRLTMRAQSEKEEKIDETKVELIQKKIDRHELYNLITHYSIQAFLSQYGGIGAQFGQAINATKDPSKELYNIFF
jgi:hypothetical protein